MKFLEQINKMMSPFNMYKGMTLGLIGIFVGALLLSVIGQLSYSPMALIASMLVFVLSTYLASAVSGWLFGIKPHVESSLITGLILTFLFTPSVQIGELVIFAFIGFIAGVSKYVITWRGRHIFNPAAFAAVVITITGLSSATWWVATPWLVPFVVLVSLLSLYKTKRWGVAGIFLLITVPGVLVQFLLLGVTLPQSLYLLLSWPLLFMATIMLTEPLTLPPKKWQMYFVSAVVAGVYLLPFQVGPIVFASAFALLVGNIVAFIFARREAIILTFKRRVVLTPTTDELVFETTAPLRYEAGQYAELTLHHRKMDFRGGRRSFSITTAPGSNEVRFGVKFYKPSSSFKKNFRELKEGTRLVATQIAGDFVLPKDQKKPLLFIAGGIGVTPFAGHIRQLEKINQTRDIVLVYAVNNENEIAYKDELVKSGIRVIIVTTQKPKNLPHGWLFSEGSRVDYDALVELVSDLNERYAYASGPTPFVQQAKSALRKKGVRSVKTDYFVGY